MIPGASFVFEKEFGAASTLSTANGIDRTNVDKIANAMNLDLFIGRILRRDNKK